MIELFFSKPDMLGIVKGLLPVIPNSDALYISIGIIGATVMPHNLYLHSSLVQTRSFARNDEGKRKAIKYNFIDTTLALNLALFVNAAILILAASAFYQYGHFGVTDIMDAHKMLAPLLGTFLAPFLFAVALIASGQSSTLTGTLTGQIIMEGYLNIRLAPWLRRLITRLLAVVPAFITIMIAGERMASVLIILSQVILSLQLGFAVAPLLHWVSSEKIMGKFKISLFSRVISWFVILFIISLNLKLVFDFLFDWANASAYSSLIYMTIFPVVIASVLLLIYTIVEPLFNKFYSKEILSPHPVADNIKLDSPKPFRKIGIGVDFSESDIKAINYSLKLGTADTEYYLIHIVESAVARIMNEVLDNETTKDSDALEKYASQLRAHNINVNCFVGFGLVENALPKAVHELGIELLLLSSHKKGFLHRLFKGTTINKVQRKVHVPVFIVK
jgi:manganese transport protein